MSIQTAARYLDASPWSMEEMFRSGEIVAYKPRGSARNGAWAVDRLELDRYVDRHHAEAAQK